MMRWFLSLFTRRPAPVERGSFSPELQARLLAVGMGRVNEGRR